MRKTFLVLIISSSLIFVPPICDASYLLLLKNGGHLTTPLYWVEGRQLYFFYAGGVVGVEKGEVIRIEKRAAEQHPEVSDASESVKRKDIPPPVAGEEKLPAAQKAPAEKLNVAEQKRQKDQLTSELNELLEKRRQAKAKKDMVASKRITEEILNTSAEVYRITDEVTEKNKGQLPEGWWD